VLNLFAKLHTIHQESNKNLQKTGNSVLLSLKILLFTDRHNN